MAAETSLRWVLLPGNHDSLTADQLWKAVARDVPENVILALKPQPIQLSAGSFVLPAPCTTRRPGRDLTEWMTDADIPSDAIRIGLAHGAVQEFGEEGASDVIAPDRAERAGLDYLALGDWHGQVRITDRSWYSGTPEPDRLKHNAPGRALVVALEARSALPVVTPVEIGRFRWQTLALSLVPGEDPAGRLAAALPEVTRRRETLLRVLVDGRTRLPERAAFEKALSDDAPDFAWVECRDGDLRTECDVADLDAVDEAGALRKAAEALWAEARSDHSTPHEAAVADAALSRLYAYGVEET